MRSNETFPRERRTISLAFCGLGLRRPVIQWEIVPWLTPKAAAASAWLGKAVLKYSDRSMEQLNTIRIDDGQADYYALSVPPLLPSPYSLRMGWEAWGKRLKQHMKDAEMTQEKVAERLEVTQGSIAHWINGRREINLTDFFRLCKASGADPQRMLFGDTEPFTVLSDLQRFLATNPELRSMIAQPSVPPIIAAAALPPAPASRAKRKRRHPVAIRNRKGATT